MIIKPQAGRQEQFLRCNADICFYGGSAGSGKTYSILLDPIRYLDTPQFNAVFFRRSIVQLRNMGGLWTETKNIYYYLDGKPREQQMDWQFPVGSQIKFAHLENDASVYGWQGSQICGMYFDEITHFTQHQFFYLMSRSRSVCGVKPYIRATTNPDKTSWVRHFIDWWIDKNSGLAISERSGVIRYFIRTNQETIWGDSEHQVIQEYNDKYNPDNDPKLTQIPKSFTFISAKLTDNQILMQSDPSYLANLQSQNVVERAKLLDGNWNVDYSDFGVVLSRSDFSRYEYNNLIKIPSYFYESYFVLDGASRTGEANDYSVLGFWARGRENKQWYIIDWVRIKLQEPDLEQLIIDKWNYWREQKYNGQQIFHPKGVNIERGACGIGMMQRLPRKNIPCFELSPDKDKFHRLNDGLGIIKSGWVNIPSAPWVDKFFDECECFRADMKHVIMNNESKPHDDQVDNLAYGVSSQVNQVNAVRVYIPPKNKNIPNHIQWT